MSDLARGALWMIGAILSFTTMAIAGREAMQAYDTFELMSYRSMVGVIVVCGALSVTKSWGKVKTNRLSLHLLRNGAHFTGQNLWFFGISLAPLAQVITLEFTSPIWLILLAPFFLGERLTRARMVAVALAFVGVLLVARPDTATLNLGTLAAATCAIFFCGHKYCHQTSDTKRRNRVHPVLADHDATGVWAGDGGLGWRDGAFKVGLCPAPLAGWSCGPERALLPDNRAEPRARSHDHSNRFCPPSAGCTSWFGSVRGAPRYGVDPRRFNDLGWKLH